MSSSDGSSSSGVPGSSSGAADTTGASSTGIPDPTGGFPIPDFGSVDPTGEPPSCDMCSTTRPGILNDGADEQRDVARDVGEAADGRGLAGSHYLFDQRVVATFFDPVSATWETPEVLRETGDWNSLEWTTLEVVPTSEGAVIIEDANGELYAHNYDTGWGLQQLDGVPGYNWIFDVVPAPDGRVAVLVRSAADWDEPAALYLVYFDPVVGEWSPDPEVVLDDAPRDVDDATLAFASDDGDAVIALVTNPEVGVYPRTVELHHQDSATGTWSVAHSLSAVQYFIPGLRELEPGEFAYSVDIYDDQLRRFEEDAGLGDPITAPMPDDYVGGTMRSLSFDYAMPTEHLTYRSFTWDDPAGTVETVDIAAPIDARAVMAADGHAYAYWTTQGATYDSYVAVYGPAGWEDPVQIGSSAHATFRQSFARNDDGDVVVAWTPGCGGGPCVGDPTGVAVYREDASCFQPTLTFEGAFDARAYPFSTTRDFALVTTVEGYLGRMLGCN